MLILVILCPPALAGTLCVSSGGVAALIAEDGTEILSPGAWSQAFFVCENRWAMGREADGQTLYALYDGEGRPLTETSYQMFHAAGGVILFRQDDLYGAMTLDGEVLLPARYAMLTTGDGERFLATLSDPWDDDADDILLVHPDSREDVFTGAQTALGLSAVNDGRMVWQDAETRLYGYLDAQGRAVIPARYETARDFQDGLAVVSTSSGLGAIDPDGSWRIDPRYAYLERSDGIFVGLIGREICVVMDAASGAELFRVSGDNLNVCATGGYALVLENGELRAYNARGEVILTTSASAALSAGLDGWLILSDGDWGAKCVSLVSPDGTIASRKDQHVLPLSDGRYAFYTMDAVLYSSESLGETRYSCDYDTLRCGMMDGLGNEILPAIYDEIRPLGSQRFLAIQEGGLWIFDADGQPIWSKVAEEES